MNALHHCAAERKLENGNHRVDQNPKKLILKGNALQRERERYRFSLKEFRKYRSNGKFKPEFLISSQKAHKFTLCRLPDFPLNERVKQ